MQSYNVDLLNEKALGVLRELEKLKLIKIRKNPEQKTESKKWNLNYNGNTSDEALPDMDK